MYRAIRVETPCERTPPSIGNRRLPTRKPQPRGHAEFCALGRDVAVAQWPTLIWACVKMGTPLELFFALLLEQFQGHYETRQKETPCSFFFFFWGGDIV